MRTQLAPLVGAAVLGFAAALICVTFVSGRPASAQLNRGLPGIVPTTITPSTSVSQAPQPLAIQGLDADHFVVASREPRLVSQVGREGQAQAMLLTVVTYYTVRGNQLLGIENVKTPTGYRLVQIEE